MKYATTLTAIICAAALAGSAFANEPTQQHKQQRQRTSSQSQARQQSGQRINLKGTLEGYRPLQLTGQPHKHVVAKIRLDNGRTAVLDLGPVSNLSHQQTQLRKGQQVEASGMPGRINRLPVIVVDRFVGDGKVTIITPIAAVASQQGRQHAQRMRSADRDRQPDALRRRGQQQAQRQQSGQRGMVTLTGRLTDLRNVNLSGISDSHRLVKLETRSGQTVIADLGTKQQLQDISLDKGEVVMVQGKLGRINGKPVVFADVIGDLARIERSSGQQQSQSRQSQFRPASYQQ